LNYTIFDTPVIRTLMRWLSIAILNIAGWRVEGRLPEVPRFVMIAAPHTSNWDFILTLLMAFALRMKIYWMGKDAIFKRPFRGFFKWLGGIPIDRRRSNNVVRSSIRQFNEHDQLVLVVPPAGTRKRVMYWKTGFYHIAHGANVPIVLGYLDYRRKAGGIGPSVIPTGNIDEDMIGIQAFYADITGKYPEKSIQSSAIPVSPA